ncbi:MAG: hypothetical protein JRJ76_08515 [Deltaproteobacteria bacterium]|nr:hypothetical protein [Deltaproteobacteria bacterium]
MVIKKNIKPVGIIIMILLSLIAYVQPGRNVSWALEEQSWYEAISPEWGGHVRAQGMTSRPDDKSIYSIVGARTYYDGMDDFRLKNRTFFGDRVYFETHYEISVLGGDTRRKQRELIRLLPFIDTGLMQRVEPVSDDRRFMDLTSVIDETDDTVFYHRLDRLLLALQFERGMVRVGRQALTWGNGLLFNPMDLFNPFAPTDLIRDYKVGDDMITAQFEAEGVGEFQFLYVPRRDPISSEVEWDNSSLASKFHVSMGSTEFDIMGARHYKDFVAGFGSTGYLFDSAWRMDLTWTFQDEGSERDGFLSLVANIDYSWIWLEKNFYGFVEFYYSGIGEKEFLKAAEKEDIVQRIGRGELFTLCRTYLAGEIQVELHPLLNIYFTVINNLNDGSRTVQPRAIWDVTNDIQLIVGGNIYYGKTGTEYGGFEIPVLELMIEPTNNAFMALTYFF